MTDFDLTAFEKEVNDYAKIWYGKYKAYSVFLKQVLEAIATPINRLCLVSAREKTLVGFAEKALRKWEKYKGQPLQHMTDLAGGRVITNTQNEVKQVCAELETLFTIDWGNTVDTSKRLGTSEFGYRSVHYIVQVPEAVSDILGVEVDGFDHGMKAEIQIRTLLEHAWSDVGHDRFYKSRYDVPKPLKRELAVCAAEMEQADKGLDELCNTLADQFEHYGTHRSQEDMDNEIEINKRMLDILTKPHPKQRDLPAITTYRLRLAELYVTCGNWEAIHDLLHEFLETNTNPNRSLFMRFRRLWAMYGNACCQSTVAKSDDGIKYLQKAMNRHDMQPATDRIHAQASVDLGKAYAAQGKNAPNAPEVLGHYSRAAAMDPGNPYILSHMLSTLMHDKLDPHALHAMNPMLAAAAKTCRQHVHVGISPWWSYFALGRLSLLAGKMYEALEAYCMGIRYYRENAYIGPERFYAGELEFIRIAKRNLPDQLAYTCVKRLIELAQTDRPNEQPPTTRYTIIAGRTDPQNPLPSRVAEDLRDALLEIENVTFLSGGTADGICGVVGEALASTTCTGVERKGYLPSKKWEQHDSRYGTEKKDFGLTDGCDDFSPLEPLKMWTDLLNKGVAPESVHVLGIGGGDMSVFEYQLATILGARVSVFLLNAKEPADDLVKNDLWHDVSNLFFLPTNDKKGVKEVMLMWAAHEPTLPPDIPLEQLAQKSHEAHNKKHPPKLEDPARANWEDLSGDLKRSNCQQTIYGELVFRQGGYTIQKAAEGENPQPPDFSKDQDSFDRMARCEHARWMVERFTSGWRYADEKDADKKLSPYLVPWDELEPRIRKYDNDAIQELAENLCRFGYKVVERRNTD